MTTSPRRPRRRLPASPVASWADQLNDYAFERGLAHLDAVNAGQVHRLTAEQQLVGSVVIYYSGGRLLVNLVQLLSPRPKNAALLPAGSGPAWAQSQGINRLWTSSAPRRCIGSYEL